MPDPWRQATLFSLRATEKIKKILAVIKGYTFVLFTSFQMLDEVYELLKEDVTTLKILRQGDMPRYLLLEEFKKKEGSVLLGTSSFWQGVDVPGKALQCVIITKLPFSVPNEPVVEAKMEFLQAQNKNPFLHYQLPQAIILLKQGFGRLIRSQEDKGVVAILDPRLKSRSYGKMFLNSLPQCEITSSLSKVKEFMKANPMP
jgi:ATP-dependent DNA helicase DinG